VTNFQIWNKSFFSQPQKEAGGIIDIEAEAKKFLIVTSQAGGSEEGHSGQQQAAFSEPDSGTHQRPVVAQAAAEQSKKHKGGSGMGKRRDFGDRKRNTRRRNWQKVRTSSPSTFLLSGHFSRVDNKNDFTLVQLLDNFDHVSVNLNDNSENLRMVSVKNFSLKFCLTLPFDVSLEFS